MGNFLANIRSFTLLQQGIEAVTFKKIKSIRTGIRDRYLKWRCGSAKCEDFEASSARVPTVIGYRHQVD